MLPEIPEAETSSGMLVNIWLNSHIPEDYNIQGVSWFSLSFRENIANHYNQLILFYVTYVVIDTASSDNISVAEC
jgi:hypothetical protein